MPLSLDDFGTGLLLAGAAQAAAGQRGQDRLLVRAAGCCTRADDQVIVRSIVDLVSALGIRSVAEGVESADVATALAAMGCDAAQGWHFSRAAERRRGHGLAGRAALGPAVASRRGRRDGQPHPAAAAEPAASAAHRGADPAGGQPAPARGNAVGCYLEQPLGLPPCPLPATRSRTWPSCPGWP